MSETHPEYLNQDEVKDLIAQAQEQGYSKKSVLDAIKEANVMVRDANESEPDGHGYGITAEVMPGLKMEGAPHVDVRQTSDAPGAVSQEFDIKLNMYTTDKQKDNIQSTELTPASPEELIALQTHLSQSRL